MIEISFGTFTKGRGKFKKSKSWGDVVKRIEDETHKEFMAKSRKIDQDLLGYLIGDYKGQVGTPQDTGRAFSSWRYWAGSTKPRNFDRGGPYSGSKQDHFSDEKKYIKYKTKLDDDSYFTNGCPYIQLLNDSPHSSQNWKFVEKALALVSAEYQ